MDNVYRKMKKFLLLAIALYLIAIYYFSSIPVPQPLRDKPDVILHFFEYGGLGFLFYLYYSEFFKERVDFYSLLFSLIFIFAYAISDEFHQSFIPGRESSLKDVVVDFIGASFFLILPTFIKKNE